MTDPVPLRDHIAALLVERQRAIDIAFAASEAQLISQRERVDLALQASQRAIDKAERVTEQRQTDLALWQRRVDEFMVASRAQVRADDRSDEQHAVTLGQVVAVVTVVVTIAAILVGAFT